MRCRSTNRNKYSLADCFHLCFGVRACVKNCKQGYNFGNRQTDRYENQDTGEESDEDYDQVYQPNNNYHQYISRSRDNPYKNIRFAFNQPRNQRNSRKFESQFRNSKFLNQDYYPAVNDYDDEEDGYYGDTVMHPNNNPAESSGHSKGVQFYTSSLSSYEPKMTKSTTKSSAKTRVIPLGKQMFKIQYVGQKRTVKSRIVVEPERESTPNSITQLNPTHCGLRYRNHGRNGLGIEGMGRIVGGEDAEPNEFPWLVSLQMIKEGSPPRHFCGASIINKHFLLTAAHCMESLKGKEHTVIGKAGINNPSEEGQVLYPEKFIIHDGWNSDQQVNDIALIKLKNPIKYETNKQDQYIINAICLPEDILEPTGQAVLAGWGQLAEDDFKSADWLQKITLPLWERQNCKVNYRQYMKVLKTHICAGGEGGQDSCMGDSGGPLVQKNEERTFQIGLVSFGIPCAIKGLPGVYTHINHFMNWIKTNMNQYVNEPNTL